MKSFVFPARLCAAVAMLALASSAAMGRPLVITSVPPAIPGSTVYPNGQFFGFASGIYRMSWSHSGTLSLSSVNVVWHASGGTSFLYPAANLTSQSSNQPPSVRVDAVVPPNAQPGQTACINLVVHNLLGQVVAQKQVCITVPTPNDSCNVPAQISFAQSDQSVNAVMTICNHSSVAHSYLLSFVPIAGQNGVTGIGCNVNGPASYVVQGPNPRTIAAGQCANVTVNISRPSGFNGVNLTACYDMIVTNQTFGTTTTCRGSLRDGRDTGVTGHNGNGNPTDFVVAPLGDTAQFFYTLTNSTLEPMNLTYQVQAVGPSGVVAQTVSIDGMPPCHAIESVLNVMPNQSVEIPVSVFVAQVTLPPFVNFLLRIDPEDDGEFIDVGSIAMRSIIPCPADLNGDLVVDFADLNILLESYNLPVPELVADINQDGAVDFEDLNVLLTEFGTACQS